MDAARIGTAGYTAMLCVEALTEKVKPDDGPIVVTGATGGVGSIAVSLLSNMGKSVLHFPAKSYEMRSVKNLLFFRLPRDCSDRQRG